MTIIFAMSDNFCIFAVENELTLMLRQNGHLPGTAGDTACDQRGANSLIITPPANARVSVGGLSALFLIQLPLSAAKLRQFLFLSGNKIGELSFMKLL